MPASQFEKRVRDGMPSTACANECDALNRLSNGFLIVDLFSEGASEAFAVCVVPLQPHTRITSASTSDYTDDVDGADSLGVDCHPMQVSRDARLERHGHVESIVSGQNRSIDNVSNATSSE